MKLCRGVLALLGVAAVISCEDHMKNALVMYGSPTSYYSVKGKVTNMKNEALKGIKVKPAGYYSNLYGRICTDAQGTFTIEKQRDGGDMVWDKYYHVYYVPLIFEDTTGVYVKDTVNVEVVKVGSGEGSFGGSYYEAKDVKIAMKEKQ